MNVNITTVGIVTRDQDYGMSLRSVIHSSMKFTVTWIESDPRQIVARAANKPVDIIILDCSAGSSDCIATTAALKQSSQSIILLITHEANKNASIIFDAMGAGAMDVLNYPAPNTGFSAAEIYAFKKYLVEKLEMIRKLVGKPAVNKKPVAVIPARRAGYRLPLIAIGSSTGGPTALVKILSRLPANLPAAVTIVQHVNELFVANLASWLNSNSPLPVRLARSGDQLFPAQVLLAGGQDHLYMTDNQTLNYTPVPEEYPYRPSVDVFFESVALQWRGPVIGILLTGMGRDGAKGLLTLRKKGMQTIAQNQESCTVFGMPRAAIELEAAEKILPIDEIGQEICESIDYKQRRKKN